jgi:hypothetical protein
MGLKIQDKKKPLQKAAFMAAKNYLAAGAAGAAAGAEASAAGAAAGAEASAAGAGATTGAGAATGVSFLPQAARVKAAAMATRTRDLFIF